MAANHTIPKLSQSQAAEIVQKHYKLTPSSLRFLPSYEDQNICITTVEGDKYVLKIMNTLSSKDPTLIKVQTCAMDFLHQGGLPTPTALKTITGEDMFLEDIDCGYGLQKYLVRLLTYLTGVPISEVPLSPQLLYQVGQIAARMDNLLKEMKHPQLSVLHRGEFVWSLSNIPLLEKWLYVLDGDPLQEIVKSVLHQFKTTVAPKYSSFRECVAEARLWSAFKRPAATPPFFKMADEPEAGRVGLLSCSELTISRRKTRQTSSRTMQRVRPSTRTDCWETSRMWP
ncbi:hydroxylysine kinase isoform X3 [Stigmatopora argus]